MQTDPPLDPAISLDEVRNVFVRWRDSRSTRQPTPLDLRRRAVALLEHYCAFHVCRALGVNASALKRWAAEEVDGGISSGPFARTTAFVPLSAEPTSNVRNSDGSVPTPALTVELSGGIRVHCESPACVAELLEALHTRHVTADSR